MPKWFMRKLIWGGISKTPIGSITDEELNAPVELKNPLSEEAKIVPDPEAMYNDKISSDLDVFCYTHSAVVTDYVKKGGAGSYTVRKVPSFLSKDDHSFHRFCCAGWSLVVVYRFLADVQPYKNILLYTRSLPVIPKRNPQNIILTDFVTPDIDNISARLLLSAAEGDHFLTGDRVYFGTTGATKFHVPIKGTNNLSENFFASQINDSDGVIDTAGTFGNANHYLSENSYFGIDGGRQGWDITEIDV